MLIWKKYSIIFLFISFANANFINKLIYLIFYYFFHRKIRKYNKKKAYKFIKS
jgi:hypothetical protein